MKLNRKILPIAIGALGIFCLIFTFRAYQHYKFSTTTELTRLVDPDTLAKIPETELFKAGQLEEAHGNSKMAVLYFQELLKRDPKHIYALEYMAESQTKLGDLKGAVQTLEKAVQLDSSEHYRKILIKAYEKAGLKNEASALRQISSIKKN